MPVERGLPVGASLLVCVLDRLLDRDPLERRREQVPQARGGVLARAVGPDEPERQGLSQRDLPLIQGVVLTYALMFALVNLIVDLSYAVIDPRVRLA